MKEISVWFGLVVVVLVTVPESCLCQIITNPPPSTANNIYETVTPPIKHPPPITPTHLTPEEQRARSLLDPGAAYPWPQIPTSGWNWNLAPQATVPVVAPEIKPSSKNATRLSWFERGLQEDVCSIPSSRTNITRLDALKSLSNSIIEAIDPQADPCQNFYQFACGGWMAKFNESAIPPEDASWSKSFSEIDKRNEKILKEVLECSRLQLGQAKGQKMKTHRTAPPPDSNDDDSNENEWDDTNAPSPNQPDSSYLDSTQRQLGSFYSACMDQNRIDERGLEPIQPIFDRIHNVRNLHEMLLTAGQLARDYQLGFFFGFGIGVNAHDPTRYIITFAQGGIPFATRDMLIGPTNVTKPYREHVTKMFQLMGESHMEAAKKAKLIVDFETEIAKLHWPIEELRIPEKMDHPMSISHFNRMTNLDFVGYLRLALRNRTLSSNLTINVAQPSHFRELAALLDSTPLTTLKDYAIWSTLNSYTSDLPREFGREHFVFFGHFLSGTPHQSARWRVCQGKAVGLMADALSKRYVEVAFTKTAEQEARDMLQHIQLAFLKRLPSLRWMTSADKLKAADKLTGMAILVGATRPEKMLNYSNVTLSPTHAFENVVNLGRFNYEDQLRRMWTRVERDRFQMPASQVNAYYDPSLNSMNFPAGIIQQPFFSEHFPANWNYAALGSVMGHELTHGFDDEGRKYDRIGALNPWWSNATAIAFANATNCLVKQYSEYQLMNLSRPLINVTETTIPVIKGFLTLGENLADQGGVTLAHLALKLHQYEERALQTVPELTASIVTNQTSIDLPSHRDFLLMQEMNSKLRNFNEKQLFYLGYAQSWCRVVRPESFIRTLLFDPHSPAEARVNIPLRDFRPFLKAFSCPIPETKANPYAGCSLW